MSSLTIPYSLFITPNWVYNSLPDTSDLIGTLKESFNDFYESNPTTSVFLCILALYYLYYVKNVVRKPELVCSNRGFRKFLVDNCPIINQEFKPTIWCAHTHAQTLLANGIRAVIPIPQYRREFVPVDDDVPPRNSNGDGFATHKISHKPKSANVTVDWYEGPGPTLQLPDGQKFYAELLTKYDESTHVYDPQISEDNGKPIAVFFPGLVGDSQTEYIRTAVAMTNSIGYKTCVFNNRARGGVKLKTPRLYCATNFDDLEASLKHIKLTHPDSRIVAVGISLGGIVLCRYLAERGDDALVDAAMLVSVCFDFVAGCKSLEEPGFNSALNLHLTKSLIRIIEENKDVLEKASSASYNLDEIINTKNLRQFDEKFTCRMWGYESQEEYHREASNKDRLHLIRKPTLCINAADDIFCPYPALPLNQIESNPRCAMIVTARGGHIGFMEGFLPYVPTFYLERLITQYLSALKEHNQPDSCHDMREVSFVNKIKFNFNGSVTKRALVIGDADNDKCNELVCANLSGDLAVFKGRETDSYARISKLGMVTACIIGDVINAGQNYIAAINTEGLLFVIKLESEHKESRGERGAQNQDDAKDNIYNEDQDTSIENMDNRPDRASLCKIYEQRMPANCKEMLIADLDGDGHNELIIGLTDRVLRTYKWIEIGNGQGKFVGIHKWEFADQIGSVSLNPSRYENCKDILVAQPGGTYARLECFNKKPSIPSDSTASNSPNEQNDSAIDAAKPDDLATSPTDNVRTEYISKLTPEYHQLALSQMRNHHISTEVLGNIRGIHNSGCTSSLIVIATLDGTLMLVEKDEILWSLQVDHQLFALALIECASRRHVHMSKSESTCTIVPNPAAGRDLPRSSHSNQQESQQYVAVCAWNGKTYIIDEERNYLRFKFDEAVSAFTAGNYHFDDDNHASLVYATFNDQIVLYYDVILSRIKPTYFMRELLNNPENNDLLGDLKTLSRHLGMTNIDQVSGEDSGESIAELVHEILYNFTNEEINNL